MIGLARIINPPDGLNDIFIRHAEKVVQYDTNGGCWLWSGARTDLGYGTFRGRVIHRRAFEVFNGPIPDGLFVCHKCDVRPCFNPDHLFLGTHQDNMDDMNRKRKNKQQHG